MKALLLLFVFLCSSPAWGQHGAALEPCSSDTAFPKDQLPACVQAIVQELIDSVKWRIRKEYLEGAYFSRKDRLDPFLRELHRLLTIQSLNNGHAGNAQIIENEFIDQVGDTLKEPNDSQSPPE